MLGAAVAILGAHLSPHLNNDAVSSLRMGGTEQAEVNHAVAARVSILVGYTED